MMSEFTGYLFSEINGRHTDGVNLNSPLACYDFVIKNLAQYPEIRVCDSDDFLIMHALEGDIVFPVLK